MADWPRIRQPCALALDLPCSRKWDDCVQTSQSCIFQRGGTQYPIPNPANSVHKFTSCSSYTLRHIETKSKQAAVVEMQLYKLTTDWPLSPWSCDLCHPSPSPTARWHVPAPRPQQPGKRHHPATQMRHWHHIHPCFMSKHSAHFYDQGQGNSRPWRRRGRWLLGQILPFRWCAALPDSPSPRFWCGAASHNRHQSRYNISTLRQLPCSHII